MACSSEHSIDIHETAGIARNNEIVEIETVKLAANTIEPIFRLVDSKGREIPYQFTYDGKMIFPVTVAAHGTEKIRIVHGEASAVDTMACGAFYPERKDDLAWENDRGAYRAYGPALQASGEQAYGYDIWTKSVPQPVVRRRYTEAFTLDKNFHEDHGDGMDVYTVGPTLGGGTAALIDSTGSIVYPACFAKYEILDNGPLRFTARLEYDGGETRVISLDAGEYLNRTEVCMPAPQADTIAAGIVIHRQNPDGYILSPDAKYMAYADLTDNTDNDNGVIYVGVVAPDATAMAMDSLAEPRGDAIGHILAKSAYRNGESYIYYWGSGWSKGFMPDWQTWQQYLAEFSARKEHPLTIHLN